MKPSQPWVRDGTLVLPEGVEIDLRLDDAGVNWLTVKGDVGEQVEANAALALAAPRLLAALKAITTRSANGEQVCFKTSNGVPMGMSKRQEYLVRSALRAANGG